MEKITKRVNHELKIRLLKVLRVTEVSPFMNRVTLTGDDLEGFVSSSPEDHVKVFFPKQGEEKPLLPTQTPEGLSMPEGVIMRDYTPSRYNARTKELDLDFVLHKKGPASQWAAEATPGQYLGIGGPRGSFIYPEFDWYFLIGDDTAIPSFKRRIQELPKGSRVIAIIETENALTHQQFETEANLDLIWVDRNGSKAGMSELLEKNIRLLDFPKGDALTFISCEKSVARRLKSVLETEYQFDPEWVKATGYWKH